jgi:SpoVK/Ycf46/Vps4 family AAA+-type ATPase
MEKPMNKAQSSSPILTPEKPAEDYQSVIWALRLALTIPETMNTQSRRSGTEGILQLVGPWVHWPDALMREFSDSMDIELAVDQPLDVTLDAEEGDTAPNIPLLREKLKQMDCGVLTQPFNNYYRRHPGKIRALFAQTADRLESMNSRSDSMLAQNVEWFARMVNLNETEQVYLLFSVVVRQNPSLQEILRGIPFNGIRRAASQFASLLNQPKSQIERVMDRKSALHRLGMFKHRFNMSDLEDLMPNDPATLGILSMEHANPLSMVGYFLEKSVGPTLCPDDFGHLAQEFETLCTLIRNALMKQEKGVHILFYGPPGTGKTEMARLLAKHIGCSLFEVRWRDDDNEPASTSERLMGLQLGLNFLSNQSDAFLLFDEVEAVIEGDDDAFGSISRAFGRRAHSRNHNKAWITQTLDNTRSVPTIWIANEIDRFDPAFLRRFVYCQEFTIPPTAIRLRAIDRHFAGMDLSSEFRHRLAKQWISPAQIESAMRATRILGPQTPTDTEQTILRSIQSSMAVLGQTFINTPSQQVDYRLDYLNVETPIPIQDWVSMARDGHPLSVCLAGPPGCGKSQLAHYLAEQLNKPLMAKRSSDILDKWVGGTEANLAAVFREAESERAILLLDEADSLLRSRDRARQSWQVSQVNELLQQMESFQGIFLCTTNRFEDLDPAALRRFTLKVRFHAMTAEQRWQYLLNLTGCDADAVEPTIRDKLNRLDGLTPGDFSVATRHFQMRRQAPTPEALLQGLEQEMKTKQWNARQTSMGFIH